ncbi:MAG: malto-oligosyltrehalose trehalohydrolase [Candidatus Dormibacteria bacterium]
MSRPRVWAPRARSVSVVTEAGEQPLTAEEGGWFSGDVELPTGTDYAFALDGGEALPDPRSPRQPHGVHGWSQTFDAAAFAWSDESWRGFPLRDAVMYELHVGTFTPQGTLDAAIDRLDDVVSLGASAVELMPLAAFPGVHGWGYDGVHLYAVHEPYGGPDALQRFVDAAHARGLAVILDVVYNHLGPDGNVLPRYGPYFTPAHPTPWGDAVNYDTADSDEVRAFVIDNAKGWVRDFHVDGLRLDAVHAIVDTSAIHIVESIATAVHDLARQLGRTVWVIAESSLCDPRVVRDPDHGGFGCDAQWSDDLHHALHVTLTGERDGYYVDFEDGDVAVALRDVFVRAGEHSPFRRRRFGRPVGDLDRTRFVGFMQNHDQVGNRARGERSAALMSVGRLHIAAALVLLGPFTPMLFAGEEWGASTPFLYFTDHQDPALGAAVSEGRRHEFESFGWEPGSVPDPQDPSTFHRSRLRWKERATPAHAELLAWHRELVALRSSTPELRGGDPSALTVDAGGAPGVLVMRHGGIVVACNWGGDEAEMGADGEVLLASPGAAAAGRELRLAPDSVAVLRRRGEG